jgi:hypothetical protein
MAAPEAALDAALRGVSQTKRVRLSHKTRRNKSLKRRIAKGCLHKSFIAKSAATRRSMHVGFASQCGLLGIAFNERI